jgi:hypothetical protein
MNGTSAPSSARMGGIGKCNMRPLRLIGLPLHSCLRVEVFKYLGWLLAHDDNDTQAMQANLATACKSWGQVSCVLKAKNTLPKVCGMFYKATVQAVLLFGSELCKLSPLSLKILEGFPIRAAHCMAGKIPTRNLDGT